MRLTRRASDDARRPLPASGARWNHLVIPGRAQREPGIHNHHREYGFRACA
jgi:hypothetical protein